MIINGPLSNCNEVLPLIKVGAESFYCGFVLNQEDFELVNRRPDYGANFTNIKDLYRAKKITDKHSISLAVVFNEFYPQSQLEKIKPLLKAIDSIGINNVIISDIGLIKYITDTFDNFEITLSIMASLFNSHAVSLIKEISPAVKKIILPYHLDFNEQKAIVSDFPEITFETFIFNELCHYEVGLCNFTHGYYRRNFLSSFIKKHSFLDSFCQKIFQDYLPYSLQDKLFKKIMTYPCYSGKKNLHIINIEQENNKNNDSLRETIAFYLNTSKMIFGCGVCFIPELYESGIRSLKIGGRNNSLKKKISNVKFVKECLNLFEDFKLNNKEDFRLQCRKLHAKLFSGKINRNITCKDKYCFVK